MGWNCLSVVKIERSSGSAVDGPDSRVGPWIPPDLEHGTSMCFSEHGWTLLMSWRSWPQPVSRVVDVLQGAYIFPWSIKSLGLEDEGRSQTWGQGPVTGGRNPDPWGKDLEDGSSSNLFMEYLSPTYQAALLIVLRCTCARCERICSLVGDWRIRKDHNVGPSKRSKGGHHRRARSGRACRTFFFSFIRMRHLPYSGKFDEEARNACIKGDATAHTQFRPDFSLRFLRLSGSEPCGGDPGILRGRILARLRIRRTKRLNKTRRPKLRILMLDSTGLACASRACKGCNGLSRGSPCRFTCCRGHSACSSWCLEITYAAICPSEVSHDQCWDDLASCFHGTQMILGMLFQSLERYIFLKPIGLRMNPEAGWTLVKETVACMDLSPGTLRIFVREPDGCVDLQRDLPVYLFDSKSSSSGRLSLIASFLEQCLPLHRPASLWEVLKTEEDMVDRHEYFQVLDLFEGDLIGFRTLILYFSGRQDLFSGLVTHDLGGMEIFVEAWRILLLEDQSSGRYMPWTYFLVDWYVLVSFTGNFRFLQLVEGRPARPNVEFAFFFGSLAGYREAVFPVLGQGSFSGTTPMEVDEYERQFVQVVNLGRKCRVPLENLASFSYEAEL
ncbi:LOW QUALITY PROTEIN: hypothetical protein HID58_002362 [Brassica napus]|uniref:Uncharacterized protein n=1 Tax=Brassica napus TaxID=3708 RepID=A0ABQ8EM09_BRANA|nr:LOW QUALITY PROTEIN: hypothetical protein HID58_002362 [Brassica napus]